jgi:flagellar hook-basal body complex protein FliE
MNIPYIQNQTNLNIDTVSNPASGEAVNDVGISFQEALEALSTTEETSNQLMEQLASGEDVDIHEVMIALEETDISFRIAVAIRDRLIEAYREVMRMAV